MMLKQRGPCGCSSVVERYPSKLDVVGSNPINRSSSLPEVTMSLISQTDREMVIEALEYYIQRLEADNCTEMNKWRWTLVDDHRPIIKMESGQQPDLRVAMNDIANTVEYMLSQQ